MLRIIDNKRVELTAAEFQLYEELVKAYSAVNRNGDEYFKDLFEPDQNGIIIFLKPPSKAFTSMECYMVLVNVMIAQHLGAACSHSDKISDECKKTTAEAKEVIAEAREIINELKKLRAADS